MHHLVNWEYIGKNEKRRYSPAASDLNAYCCKDWFKGSLFLLLAAITGQMGATCVKGLLIGLFLFLTSFSM